MLPARNRLKQAQDFRAAFRSGLKARTRFLVVHSALDTQSHATRVGFVVSKAVGNAVTRNRVKRRLRAIVASQLNELPPAIYVVRAQAQAATASYAELAEACTYALARVAAKAQARLADPDNHRNVHGSGKQGN